MMRTKKLVSLVLAAGMVLPSLPVKANGAEDEYISVTQSIIKNGWGNGDRTFITSGGSGVLNKNNIKNSQEQNGTKFYTLNVGDLLEKGTWNAKWDDVESVKYNYQHYYKTNELKINGINYAVDIPFKDSECTVPNEEDTGFKNIYNIQAAGAGNKENGYINTIDVADGYYTGISFLGAAYSDKIYIRYVYDDATKSEWRTLSQKSCTLEDSTDAVISVKANTWIRVGTSDTDPKNPSDELLYLHTITNSEIDSSKKLVAIEFPKRNTVITDISGEPQEGTYQWGYDVRFLSMTLLTDNRTINNVNIKNLESVWNQRPEKFVGNEEQIKWLNSLCEMRGKVDTDLIDVDAEMEKYLLCMEIDEYILTAESYTIPVYTYIEPTDFANRANWFLKVGESSSPQATETGLGFEPSYFKGLNLWENGTWTGTQNVLSFNGYKYKVNVDTQAGNGVAFHAGKSSNKNSPAADKSAKSDFYYRFNLPRGNYESISFLGGTDYRSEMLFAARLNYADGSSTGFIDADMAQLQSKGNKEDYIELKQTKLVNGAVAQTDGNMYLHQVNIDADLEKVLVSVDLPVQDAYISNGVITGNGNNEYARYDYNILGISLKTNKHAADEYKENYAQISEPVNIFENGWTTDAMGRLYCTSGGSGLANVNKTVNSQGKEGTKYYTVNGDWFAAKTNLAWQNEWSELKAWKDAAKYKNNTLSANGTLFEISVPFSKQSGYEKVYTNTDWPGVFNAGAKNDGSEENGYVTTLDVKDGYYTGVAFLGATQGIGYIRYVYTDGTKSEWVALENQPDLLTNAENAVAVQANTWIRVGTEDTDTSSDAADDKLYLHLVVNNDANVSKIVDAIEFPKGNSIIEDVAQNPVPAVNWKNQTRFLGMSMLTNKVLKSKSLKDETTEPIEIYVAADGDDSASGSINAPLATISGAVLKAQEKDAGSLYARDVVITVDDGEYEVNQSIKLENLRGKVTLKAKENANVVVKGSKTVPISKMTDASDPRISVAGVKEYDLSDYTLADKICTGTNSLVATNTFGVFADNEIRPVAEYPNNGELVTDDVFASGNPGKDNTITLTHEKFGEYANTDGWFIEGYIKEKYRTWKSDDFTISGNDLTFNNIKSSSVYSLYRNWRIFNILEELDTAGEWYVDKNSKKLYYLPKEGETEIEISNMTDALVDIGLDNVLISGIKFKNTCANAIDAKNVSNLKIEACKFSEIGRNAINAENVSNAVISGNIITDVGYKGINISGGNIDTLTKSQNAVLNNTISSTGKIVRAYAQAIYSVGVGDEIKNNNISNIRSIAIGFGGALNRIVCNKLDNIVNESLDAGAIYGGRNLNYLGNEVAYNEITLPKRDVGSEVVSGVYLDDGLSGTKVHHNIVRNATRGIFSNGGALNSIYNNVFEDCTAGVQIAKWDFSNSEFDLAAPVDNQAYIDQFGSEYLNTFNTVPYWSAEKLEIYNNYAKNCTDTVLLRSDLEIVPIKNENNVSVSALDEGLSKADIDENKIGIITDDMDRTVAWTEINGTAIKVYYVSTYANYAVLAAAKDEEGNIISIKKVENSGDEFKLGEVPARVDIFVFEDLNTIKPMTKK